MCAVRVQEWAHGYLSFTSAHPSEYVGLPLCQNLFNSRTLLVSVLDLGSRIKAVTRGPFFWGLGEGPVQTLSPENVT